MEAIRSNVDVKSSKVGNRFYDLTRVLCTAVRSNHDHSEAIDQEKSLRFTINLLKRMDYTDGQSFPEWYYESVDILDKVLNTLIDSPVIDHSCRRVIHDDFMEAIESVMECLQARPVLK